MATTTGEATVVFVDNTASVHITTCIVADGRAAVVLLTNSTITFNMTGLSSTNSSAFDSYKTNNINGDITTNRSPNANET